MRSTARDLGRQLAVGGYLGHLVRTAYGPLHLDRAAKMEELTTPESVRDRLLPAEVILPLMERVRLNFGHRITNQDGKLILEAETFHACTTRAEKPRRLPEELAASLGPLVVAGRISF